MLLNYVLFLAILIKYVSSTSQLPSIQSLFNLFFRSRQKPSKTPIFNQTDQSIIEDPSLFDFVEIIRCLDFFGSWFSTDQSNLPLSFFSHNSGFLFTESIQSVPEFTKIKFRKSYQSIDFQPKELASESDFIDLLIKLYDGNYIDEKSADLFLYITSSSEFYNNVTNSTLSLFNISMQLELKNAMDVQNKLKSCPTDISIFFIDSQTTKPLDPKIIDPDEIFVQLQLQSQECNLYILTTLMSYRPQFSNGQIMEFIGLVTALGIIHCIAAYLMRKSLRTKKLIYQVSIMSIWLIASTDYYLLITNLVLAFALSSVFVIPIFIYIILNFHFERELIIKISDNRRIRNFTSDDDWRGCGFSFAVASILFLIELIGVIMGKLWIIQLSSLIYVPQIIHNQIRNKRFVLNFPYIFLFGIPRLAFIAYLKGYPDNILRMTPDYSFIAIYAGSLFLQIAIILIQYKIPHLRKTIPFKIGPECNKSQDDVCSICYEDFFAQSDRTTTDLEARILELRVFERDTIQIKCGHMFHVKCILEWAKQRSVCPMCRLNIEDVLEEFEDDSTVSSTLS